MSTSSVQRSQLRMWTSGKRKGEVFEILHRSKEARARGNAWLIRDSEDQTSWHEETVIISESRIVDF